MSRPFYTSTDLNNYPDFKSVATKDVPESDTAREANRPKIYSSMARTRIACAGVRKTRDESAQGIDNGYCICFP